MANQEFKNGDVVYHKANNLRMVVIEAEDDGVTTCRFVDSKGEFSKLIFFNCEIQKIRDTTINVKSQLEIKG
ncbi:hypothetical protein [Sphingobacterium detergens]